MLAPFLGILPPNFGIFFSQNSTELPPGLGSMEEFSKTPKHYCSSAIGLEVPEKNLQFRGKTTVSHQSGWKTAHIAQGPVS